MCESVYVCVSRRGDNSCSQVVGLDFPAGSDGKASPYNVRDPGLIPGLGRSSGEGNGNPLQYSCLENPMDGGAWQATVHGVAKSQTRLSHFISLQQSCKYFHFLFANVFFLFVYIGYHFQKTRLQKISQVLYQIRNDCHCSMKSPSNLFIYLPSSYSSGSQLEASLTPFPRGTFDNDWRHCLMITTRFYGTTGTQRVEARNAAKHPTVHRTAHHLEEVQIRSWPQES